MRDSQNLTDTIEQIRNLTDVSVQIRFDEDEDFKKASQLAVVTLQSGDEFSLQCWKTLCDVSRDQFKLVYDRLQIEGLNEQVKKLEKLLGTVFLDTAWDCSCHT